MSSPTRLRILELLSDNIYNISEIAAALELPFSTANLHVNTLEAAGLLLTEYKPGARGSQKICARAYNTVVLQHAYGGNQASNVVESLMPVGAYTGCEVSATCGLASANGIIGLFDDPMTFYEPERLEAQLLWFHYGYVEYHFPNRLPPGTTLESLQLSLELCSEAPLHHASWPSDITLTINGVEVGTWTSPADFGGQRGALTPSWWETHNSQYGLLKVWQTNKEGSFIDGMKLSGVRLQDLDVRRDRSIAVKIGVKEGARHRGGMNIFGRCFGNYPQDLLLSLRYRE